MAVSISETMRGQMMFAGVMSSLFEEMDWSLKPSKIEVERDVFRMQDVGVLHFHGFMVRVDIPYMVYEGTFDSCINGFKQALLNASVYYPEDAQHHLNARTGIHSVAAIGGYAHGDIIQMDISKPTVRIAAAEGVMSGLACSSNEAVAAPDALTVLIYELMVFNGGGIPAYVLVPLGDRPEESFIKMAFEEFPLLGLLPASQGFNYKETAFLNNGVMLKPLRVLPFKGGE